MTVDKLIAEMDQALQIPGVSNAWTMRIRNRIDMLATGIRTPIDIKLFGQDLADMERLAQQIEQVVKTVPGTTSAYAERITGGFYLNIAPDYEALARYGLSIGDMQDLVGTAIGGETVTTMVEGRERFGVIVRYPRQLRDIDSYVRDARQAVELAVQFPPGYYIAWSGQFEYMERAKQRLQRVVPLTLGIIFILLYFNFGRLTETLIVIVSVPFALIGGIWLLWFLDYNVSVAETGVVMLIISGSAIPRFMPCVSNIRSTNNLNKGGKSDNKPTT